MQETVTALLMLLAGMLCLAAWGLFRVEAARRDYQLRRHADAAKLHVIHGGAVPEGFRSALARGFFRVQWLGILANLCLVAGVAIIAIAQFYIF